MITTKRLPGFWYCDNTPDGQYVAAQFGTSVIAADREIPSAPAPVLQIRISPDGLKYAGAAGTTFLNTVCWFNGVAWLNVPAAVTPNCAIFGRDNALMLADPAITGSQGYRYIDDAGQPVPSYLTYAPGDPASTVLRAAGVTNVDEATILGDVVVGQGPSGGCVIRYQGALYQIEPGDTTFVRFSRSGVQLAIAILVTHAPGNYEAVFYWLTTADIATLTRVDAPTPPVPVPTPPSPSPVPPPAPEPSPMSPVPDLSALLHDVAATHNLADNSVENCASIVHDFVERARAVDEKFGYVSKTPGETQFQGRSQDSAAYDPNNPISVKLISGAGDAHGVNLVWVIGGPLRTTDHWLYPDSASFGPVPTPQPTPTPQPAPTPTPAPVDLAPLEAEIAELKTEVAALEAKPEPDLSQFAKHGDSVQVTGSESFGDILSGKKVTWGGKIQ